MFYFHILTDVYDIYINLDIFDTPPKFRKFSLRPTKSPTLKGFRRMMIPKIRADP